MRSDHSFARLQTATRTLVIVAFALFAASCGTVVTREEDHEAQPLPGLVTGIQAELLWYRQSQGGHDVDEALLAPAVQGGRFYFVDTPPARLFAVKAPAGRRLWRKVFDPPAGGEPVVITSGPGLSGDMILLGTREGEVIALRQDDGRLLWRSRVSSEVLSPPVSDGRVVVVHVNDGRLFGLDARDGRRLWVYESSVPSLSLRGTSTPLIDSRKVIVGLASGKLVALALQDGKVIWEATVAVPQGRSELERIVDVDGDPVLRDGVIYAAAYHGRVVAVSAATGRILWGRDVSTYHSLLVDRDHVYVSDENGVLLALERRSGAILWQQEELQGRILSAPARDGELLVVGDASGYLHWLSPEDGTLVARHQVSPVGLPGPIVSHDGVLYLKDQHNAVYVLQTKKLRQGE